MPGGRRNVLSISHMLECLHDIRDRAKDGGLTKKLEKYGHNVPFVDLSIQFIGAANLPRMDVVGYADPYFVAKIDNVISYVSTVKEVNASPVWNEIWRVKNVPATADLVITVMDKDEGSYTDDLIGIIKTSVSAGAKEMEIESPTLKRARGTFWLKIDSNPAEDDDPSAFPYLFNGPIRFSRHFSPTVGVLTNLDDARLYSTWKLYIMGAPQFFGDIHQPWNRNYKAARSIFQGPTSIALRRTIQAGHRMLYARTARNGFGTINTASDFLGLLTSSESHAAHGARIKPAVYTYIISSEDDSFRFSETGAAFFVDFASKHALHANCCEKVRYSGEFFPRPQGGWETFSDDTPDDAVPWELVIDNNSGTYAPDKEILPLLRALLEYNFPCLTVYALHHEDEELKNSREACREYAVQHRGIKPNELQPHVSEGETTLMSSMPGIHIQQPDVN